MNASDRLSLTVLAVLRAAREQLDDGLLKTALVKYVYLLDVFVAEASGGQTWSGDTWRFVHFGPFAPAVVEAADRLAAKGQIAVTKGEDVDADNNFTYYRLPAHHAVKTLHELGVPSRAALQLLGAIKRFGNNLPKLLDYVYFRTAPMADAEPGRALDFSTCQAITPDMFRAIPLKPISKNDAKRAREAIRNSIQRRHAAVADLAFGPYDDVYLNAMQAMETGTLATFGGKAALKVSRQP